MYAPAILSALLLAGAPPGIADTPTAWTPGERPAALPEPQQAPAITDITFAAPSARPDISSPARAAAADVQELPSPIPPQPDKGSSPPLSAQTSPTSPDLQEEIVVSSRRGPPRGDPFEKINAKSYEITQKVDDAVVGPAARAYRHVTPKPVRQGLRNFFHNLREPVVFANYLLQLKFGKASETAGRFALNSTLGVGGLFDVAKRCPFRLPWRPNGFSDTLGVYGMKEGPYLFLPLLGPTTVRDLIGGAVDRLASPVSLGGPFKSRAYVIGSSAYGVLDRRAEMDDELRTIRQSADPYGERRDRYLRKRQSRVDALRARRTGDGGDTPADSANPAPTRVPESTRPRC